MDILARLPKAVFVYVLIGAIIGVNAMGSRGILPGRESSIGSVLRFFFSIPGVTWSAPTLEKTPPKKAGLQPWSLLRPAEKEISREVPIDNQPEPESLDLGRIIKDTASQYGLDPLLIKAVIRIESGFDPNAASPKGAMGLMQLMPETAEGLGVVDPFDPTENVRGGAKYLAGLLDEFDGDLRLALAAYNAGPETVRRYQGLPPFEETQRFVARVLETYGQYKALVAKKLQ